MIADELILDKLVVAKQQVDLCTAPFNQRVAARFIQKGYLRSQINLIIDMYREKRDGMLKAFEEYMPEGVKWTHPEGGLFLFLTLPEHMNAEELFKEAIKEKVAFVIGNAFYCDNTGLNTIRINFSYASKEQNIEGVKRLARVIRSAM